MLQHGLRRGDGNGAGRPARGPGVGRRQPTAPPAKAKSVIQIWLWGGPSHLDTFDPKPEAGNDYCGPLNKPIATNVEGIRIGELLPLLAKQADKYSLIRSMTHGNNGHETAAYLVQTGRKPGDRVVYPERRGRGRPVQGQGEQGWPGLDPALHRADPAAGPLLRGGLPGQPLQAVRHRRRPERGPVRRRGRRRPGHRGAAATAARPARPAEHAGLRRRRAAGVAGAGQVRGRGLRPDPGRRRQGVRPDQEKDELRDATAATPSASRA